VVNASTITAGELIAALQIAREVEDARRAAEQAKTTAKPEPAPELEPAEAKPAELEPVPEPEPAAAEEIEPSAPEENVTSLSSARHIK
jgi:hypothetical protein